MFTIEDALNEIDFDIKIDNSTYINSLGNKVPRVTDILSKTISEESLMRWSNSLGFKHKSYTQVLAEAANYGSETHEQIEEFYKSDLKSNCGNISFQAFLMWWNDINKNNVVEVIYVEKSIVCNYFGGTLDTLLKINNKYILIDYKTSNHITFKYLLQAAAYRYMLYHVLGINIDGIIILQLGKESPMYNELYIDLLNNDQYEYMEYCTQTFLSMVYTYYNVQYVREGFTNIA